MICLQCNSNQLECTSLFKDELEDSEHVFIECHGATIYESGTNQVEQGVSFHDNGKGYDIETASDEDVMKFGLQTMRDRIVSMGGALHYESTIGEGTKFSFTIPVSE